MLPLILAFAAAGGALVWHLQRRRSPRLSLSFARLLPVPKPSTTPERRFSPIPPLRSLAFWLRMATLATALAVLLVDLPRFGAEVGGQGIGLMLVIDTGDTMRIADGGVTRLQQALTAARVAADRAATGAGQAPFCAAVTFVGDGATVPVPLTPGVTSTPQPVALDAARLRAAAGLGASFCAVTHAVVFTDLPRPVGALPAGLPPILWHQIGAPLANTGLREVLLWPASLTGAAARIEFRVEQFSPSPAPETLPTLRLSGPDGSRAVVLSPAPNRDGAWLGNVPFGRAGAYVVELTGDADAWDGDDKMAFDLPAVEKVVLDWQMPGVPAPSGVAIGAGGVFAGPVEAAVAERPALLVYDGWGRGGATQTLGAFVEDPLLNAINLDVLEAKAPSTYEGALPTGFVPVLQLANGNAPVLARRARPPGLLVPAPVLQGDPDVVALSLTLFYSALTELAQVTPLYPTATWRGRDNRSIDTAWRRSNLARPLAPPDSLDAIQPSEMRTAAASPGWPWAVVAMLVLLALERLWALSEYRGKARYVV